MSSTHAHGGRLFRGVMIVLAVATTAHEASNAEEGTEDNRISMVFFAPKGPVLVDLQIDVSGSPWRTWVADFLTSRLDADRSGDLSVPELIRTPEQFLKNLGLNTTDDVIVQATSDNILIENDQGALAAKRDVFNEWFSSRLGDSMRIVAQPVAPAQAVRLGELLDTDGDGSVGPAELRSGLHTLRFRDLDDDQTLSATELLPFRDPRNQLIPVTPEAADLPFMQLGSEDAVDDAAGRIARRYGGTEGMIAFARLRTHPQLLTGYDKDSDRKFSREECRAWLKDSAPHLSSHLKLSELAARSRLNIKASVWARRFCRIKTLKRGRVQLHIDDMPVEIRSHGGSRGVRRDLKGFLGQHFSVSDEDDDNQLSEEEFHAMANSLSEAQLNVDFSRIDIDEDGQLSRKELNAIIETTTIATQSQIEVSVRQDGRTMFSLLDSNRDRRLSQRELREGQTVLTEFDANGDGQLAEAELGTRYILQVGLGQPAWKRDSMQMMSGRMTSTDAVLPGIDSLSGPQWFRRMDRNQDGDLSRREFLGTRQQFDTLDTDQDDLIDVDEAEAVTSGSS